MKQLQEILTFLLHVDMYLHMSVPVACCGAGRAFKCNPGAPQVHLPADLGAFVAMPSTHTIFRDR